jgi:hypothetical protein
VAVEFKSSKAPTLTKGFRKALQDVEIGDAWIIAPIDESYPLKDRVHVSGLAHFIRHIEG